MNDMFGRRINEGDIVVYVSRSSSTSLLMIAKVTKTSEMSVRVRVVAGNNYTWKTGKSRWNRDQAKWEKSVNEGYATTLHACNNVMVANGIDAGGIHEQLVAAQRSKFPHDEGKNPQ